MNRESMLMISGFDVVVRWRFEEDTREVDSSRVTCYARLDETTEFTFWGNM